MKGDDDGTGASHPCIPCIPPPTQRAATASLSLRKWVVAAQSTNWVGCQNQSLCALYCAEGHARSLGASSLCLGSDMQSVHRPFPFAVLAAASLPLRRSAEWLGAACSRSAQWCCAARRLAEWRSAGRGWAGWCRAVPRWVRGYSTVAATLAMLGYPNQWELIRLPNFGYLARAVATSLDWPRAFQVLHAHHPNRFAAAR